MQVKLYYDLLKTPLGPLWMVSSPEGLSFLIWQKTERGFLSEVRRETGLAPAKNPGALRFWRGALTDYFSGRPARFERPVSFLVGTPFQRKVWRTLSEIPHGEVRSYQWIADRMKRGRAARAVGNACGKNPLPIVIPCHRVVRRNGSLGGYTGGLGIKKRLLAIEGMDS